MAEDNEDRDIVDKKDTSKGHELFYNFFIGPILGRLPFRIVREYHTDCRILPTSWRFQITFRQNGDNGPVSCFVQVKRIDEINAPVRVFGWISCFIFFQTIFDPRGFSKERIRPNEVIELSMNEIVLPPQIEVLLSKRGLLQYFMEVKYCHSRLSAQKVSNCEEISGMLFSKM